MQWAYNLSQGGTPLMRKYQVGESMAVAGVPVLVGGSNAYGVKKATTTAAANMMGLSLDIVTTVTAQQSDNSDPSRYVTLIINPDAVFKARACGGSTSGTAITDYAETSGDTAGLTVTASGLVSADEGSIVCSFGANKSTFRKNITGGSGSAVAGVAFTNDIAIGDKFFTLPVSAMDAQTVTLTSDLSEVNQTSAVATNTAALQPVEIKVVDKDNPLTDTYIFLVSADHCFASS